MVHRKVCVFIWSLVTVPAASDLQQAPEQAARTQVLRLAFVRSAPPDSVGSTEDRLCEPRFQRSTALSGVRVFAQDYLDAGTFPRRNQDKS